MSKINNTELLIDGPAGQLQLLHSTVNNDSDELINSNCIAIICHPHPLYSGSMNNKVVHIINKTFNSAGLNTIRFNFRGVEKSQGEFANAIGEVDDLLAVIEWAKKQSTLDSMYLAGFSFGSFIAAQVASRSDLNIKIEKVLLIAPPVGMYDFDAVDIKQPCLVIQGGLDTVVDPANVKTWFDSQADNFVLEWHEEAEHFFHGKLNFIRDSISKHWFE